MEGSELTVAVTVQIDASGRAPAVIDASSQGAFDAVLSGGDDATGVFLQNGAAPAIGPGIKQSTPAPPLPLPKWCP